AAKEEFMSVVREKLEAIEAQKRAEEEAEEARKAAEWARLNVVYEDKPLSPRLWNSTTSTETESEVKALTHRSIRERVELEVTRPKKFIGQKYTFLDRDADVGGVLEFRAHKDPHFLSIRQGEMGIQAAPMFVDHHAQTTWNRPVNKAVQCQAGPEAEEPSGVEEREELCAALERAAMKVEKALQQNETLDIFHETFEISGDEDTLDGAQAENELRELKNFADPTYSKLKVLPAVDWMPKAQGMVAVSAVRNMTFDQRLVIAGQTSVAYLLLWDFRQLVRPQVLMQCPHEILAFRFNATNPNMVAGGCVSGQVVLWDITESLQSNAKKGRRGNNAAQAQNQQLPGIDIGDSAASTDPVCLPKYISNSHQFITVAGDGQLLVWDTRFEQIAADELRHVGRSKHVPFEKASNKEGGAFKLLWTPIFRAHLKRMEGVGELSLCRAAYSAMAADSPSFLRSQVMLSTEEGDVLSADLCGRKTEASKEDEDEDSGDANDLVRWTAVDHSRPCVCLQISPFFPDIMLSVGDWKFHIWKIGEDRPLFISPTSPSHMTAAAWSPNRPAVLVVACADGSLMAWDFTDSSYRPSIELKATHTRITSMEFLNSTNTISSTMVSRQQLLAVGDEGGTLHIFEMPRNITRPVPNEESIMRRFLDRELKRLNYIKETTASAGDETEGKQDSDMSFTRVGTATADAKQDSEGMDSTKALSAEALQKGEDDFAKLEAQFIAELELRSDELPDYARQMGIDLAPPEEDKKSGKMR
ncbi:DNAI3, partial [Symbiodinium microadriaticum]